MNIMNKKSKGAISGIILILAAVLIVVIIVVFVVIKIGASKNESAVKTTDIAATQNQSPTQVFQKQLGDVNFMVQSAVDLGTVLASKDTRFSQSLTTTERFIQVTLGAQNMGKTNTKQGIWGVGNIVDSDERNFIPINDKVQFYLPNSKLCGSIIKPAFAPTPCVMIYEVARASAGLKVQVHVTSPKKQEAFLDINVE